MLLATNPFHQPFEYAPARPSPLSPRSANVPPPRIFNFSMASPSQNEKKAVPQRPHKPVPIMQTRDQATQRRRDMFFRRVQRDRDDRKWEARGEQIQRLDFISDHKRWEAEKARQAPELQDDLIEDEDELPMSYAYASSSAQYHQQSQEELSEADYVLLQEQRELEALIAAMEDEENQEDTGSQHFGSDDVDYDQLFMEVTADVDMQQHQTVVSNTTYDTFDDMDMEMTDG